MALGLFAWLVASIALLAWSCLLARHVKSDRLSLDLPIFVFLLIFLATAFVLAMGLLGLLRVPAILLASLIALAATAVSPGPRRAILETGKDAQSGLARARDAWASIPVWLRWFAVCVSAVSAVRFGFLVWALPPFTWDSLTYHLTNVAQWTQKGRIFIFETPVNRIYSPANYEVFATWFTVFLHHDMVVEASGIPAYLLAVLAVYALGRSLSLSRGGACLASVAYGSTPGLLLAATQTKNDPAMAGFYLLAMAVIVDLAGRDLARGKTNVVGLLTVFVLVLLTALGTKPYIAHLSLGLVVLALAEVRRSGGAKRAHEFCHAAREELRAGGARLWIILSLTCLAALLLGLYWYARNSALTGNPFFPYGVELGDRAVFSSAHHSWPLSLENLRASLEGIWFKFGDRREAIMPDLTNVTGWGWVAYGPGLATLAWALARRPRFRMVLLGFVMSFVALMLSMPTSPWNMRYVIWFPAVLCLSGGSFWDWLISRFQWERLAYQLLLIVCVVMNFAMTLNYNRISLDRLRYMLSFPAWNRQAATLKLNMPPEYENAIVLVPPHDTLGYNVHGNGFVYPLYRANLSQQLVYVPIGARETCASVADQMSHRGAKWLFVAEGHTDPEVIALVNACTESGLSLIKMAEGIYALAN